MRIVNRDGWPQLEPEDIYIGGVGEDTTGGYIDNLSVFDSSGHLSATGAQYPGDPETPKNLADFYQELVTSDDLCKRDETRAGNE